jgi:hypothetical protein
MSVDPGHPLTASMKLLRKTRGSCTKAHAPEDDDTRLGHRLVTFPSGMLFAPRREAGAGGQTVDAGPSTRSV